MIFLNKNNLHEPYKLNLFICEWKMLIIFSQNILSLFIIQQCCTSFCFSYFISYSKVILGYQGDSSVSKEHIEMKYDTFEVWRQQRKSKVNITWEQIFLLCVICSEAVIFTNHAKSVKKSVLGDIEHQISNS